MKSRWPLLPGGRLLTAAIALSSHCRSLAPLYALLSAIPDRLCRGSLLKTLLNCSALACKLSLGDEKHTKTPKAEVNPACHVARR